MSRLERWMKRTHATDESLGALVGVSRVQISRIRRGVNGASKVTAKELERVTGIPWYSFIEPGEGNPPKRESNGASV